MTGEPLTLVNYYDRLFDQALTGQYSLSIRVDPDGLSFSVYSPLVSRYIGIESVLLQQGPAFSSGETAKTVFSDRLKDFLIHHEWILNPFRHVSLIVHSPVYTLIPHALYNPESRAEYLAFAHQLEQTNVVHEQFLNAAEAWLVYSVNKSIDEVIEQYFGSARLLHHAGAMIETILPHYRHNELQNPVFVNVRQGSFDIIVLNDGRLRYCNSFSWKANEDLVYYLIFVLDQLALNPENVPVMLSGLLEPDSALFALLQQYIRHVGFMQNPETAKPGISLPVSNDYKFFDLLNPGLCE